ncbi:unnamed protein product, partial [Brassica oleracea]
PAFSLLFFSTCFFVFIVISRSFCYVNVLESFRFRSSEFQLSIYRSITYRHGSSCSDLIHGVRRILAAEISEDRLNSW